MERYQAPWNFMALPAALGDDAPLWGAIALAEDLI